MLRRKILRIRRAVLAGSLFALTLIISSGNTSVASADDSDDSPPIADLLALELDDLMEIEVSLVSRNPEPQFKTPAAAYVITEDQIRRSSMSRIPELLRLVPGMQVGKISANNWSISPRSDPTQFAPRTLVQMDGRSLYTPLFGGVEWDVQDTMLQDIDRIEVIRGPGLSLWGSNATNGIVNIVTKDARATQGVVGYLQGGVGGELLDGGGRYGVQIGEGAFLRVYSKARWSDTGEYLGPGDSNNNGTLRKGADAHDDGGQVQSGFRMDWDVSDDTTLTVQGDGYTARYNDITPGSPGSPAQTNDIRVSGANLLTRWSNDFTPTSRGVLQIYWDYSGRKNPTLHESRHTFDIDWQHGFELPRQQLTWGSSIRTSSDDVAPQHSGSIDISPKKETLELYSIFVQDRIRILDDLALIVGTKWEHNSYTDSEWQPSGRLLWTPNSSNTIWLGVTRPVRIPSRLESDGWLQLGPISRGLGTSRARRSISYELGYRADLDGRALLDAAFFYDDYFNSASIARDGGNANDWVWGVELDGRFWLPYGVRLEASYAYRDGKRHRRIGAIAPQFTLVRESLAGMAENSGRIGIMWDIRSDLELNTNLFYVDETYSSEDDISVPAYWRLDVGMRWRPATGVELALTGTNLLESSHAEDTSVSRVNTGVYRGVLASVTIKY